MKLKELRISKNIPAKDMVDVVRRIYPKFDKSLLSKCESDAYGAELPEDALQALYAAFAPEAVQTKKRSHSGKNLLTCRITARLPNDVYELLQQRIRANGYDTMQSFLSDMVKEYLKTEEHNGNCT